MHELERGWRRIVSELGIEFLHRRGARGLPRTRARTSRASVVKLDPDWILEQVAKAPRGVRPAGAQPRAERPHRRQPHGLLAPSTAARSCARGSSAATRRYDDFQNLVRLAQAFPQLDSPGGTICEPNDKPLDSRHLDMVYALLTLSDKPFMGSVTSGPNAADTIAMAEMVFGRESIEQTPAIISLINVNSPLRYDDRMLAALLEYAKANQADDRSRRSCSWARCRRSRSPATLAQQVGEALAGIALVQTIRPGCPVVFGSFLSNTDMQSGSPSFGTPESAIGLLCTGQIARHYDLPFRGGGALTSSQVGRRAGGATRR